jgi:hypothetical protein
MENQNVSIKVHAAKAWKDISSYLKTMFKDDLDQIYKTPESDLDRQKIQQIRKINLIEFISTLGIVVFAMWVPWWQGILQDSNTLQTIGFAIIGVVGIWGILISPFYHYHIEKGYTYRNGYLGLKYNQTPWTAFFEERGLGSLVQYRKVFLKDAKGKKIATLMTLYVLMTIVMWFMQDFGVAEDIADMFTLTNDTMRDYAAITGVMWVYQGVAVCLAVYSIFQAGQWQNTGNKDGLKKFWLIFPPAMFCFLGMWFAWGFGISFNQQGTWNATWASPATMFQTVIDNFWNPSNQMGAAVLTFIAIYILAYFLLKYLILGLVIRFDNLLTASFQLIFIVLLTIVVVSILNIIMGTPSVNAYILTHQRDQIQSPALENMWLIFDDTAEGARNTATVAKIFANWGYYVWWGLAQELLFLGYWCTLMTKVTKNKFINAILSASCFGFIHFPSWPLMILTVVAGFFWALAWQRNDGRNLFILGASHGFGGTLVAKYIPITMSVGPSNMQ